VGGFAVALCAALWPMWGNRKCSVTQNHVTSAAGRIAGSSREAVNARGIQDTVQLHTWQSLVRRSDGMGSCQTGLKILSFLHPALDPR
jgi:hypothetical protein